MMKTFLISLTLFLSGCVGMPENIKPVDHFNSDRYLGKWYEIARMDHSFERGLSKVSATYSLRDDGGIRVINRGYDSKKQKWKEAEGKAYFVNGADQGYLKVSFFGPFYGAYIVVELDHEDYQYSLVCGPDRSYLWILLRTSQMDQSTQKRLLAKAAALGFDTGKLIFVEQDSNP